VRIPSLQTSLCIDACELRTQKRSIGCSFAKSAMFKPSCAVTSDRLLFIMEHFVLRLLPSASAPAV